MREQDTGKQQDREDRRARKVDDVPAQQGARFSIARSGWLTVTILGATLLVFALLWRAHERAQFHQFTTPAAPQVAAAETVGGAEPLVLSRLPLDRRTPEFVSATLLPGIGMQVLQLSVALPGIGTRNILAGPSIAQAATMPGTSIDSAPFHLVLSPPGTQEGESIDVIADRSATDVINRTEVDGGEATGTFAVLDSEGKATGVDAKVETVLSGRFFNVTVHVHNNALSSRQFALTWSPHFAAPGHDLSQFLLTIPATEIFSGGNLQTVRGTSLDYSAVNGRPLTNTDTDTTYVSLEREELGDGPSVMLLDRQTGLRLRMSILSPSIRSVRVRTDTAAHTLMLGFGTRGSDGATSLQAGESADWHLRIDIVQSAAAEQGLSLQ